MYDSRAQYKEVTIMRKGKKDSLVEAHRFSSNNKEKLKKDDKCGCFYCLNIFSPSDIEEWLDCDIGHTALCPYCGIDSVIGESSGYPITKEFLKKMQDKWF